MPIDAKRVKDLLRTNAGYLSAFVLSAVYVATSVFTIGETGKTVSQIIADGSVIFFLGFFINRIFDIQGMMNGERDEKMMKTRELYGDTVRRISPHLSGLDEFCKRKNVEALRNERFNVLISKGMNIDDYFNNDGTAKEFPVFDGESDDSRKTREKAFKKALKICITKLSPSDLTTDGGKAGDPLNLGKKKNEYERSTAISDIASKLMISVFFGYFGVRIVQEFSVETMIWYLLQASIMLVCGVTKMFKSYNFVVDEYRSRIIRKIDFLEMFEAELKSKGVIDNGNQEEPRT